MFSSPVDQFGQRHPRLIGLVLGVLTAFVTLVLLTATEAPSVLYQAF